MLKMCLSCLFNYFSCETTIITLTFLSNLGLKEVKRHVNTENKERARRPVNPTKNAINLTEKSNLLI
jgi:hypothetical protein